MAIDYKQGPAIVQLVMERFAAAAIALLRYRHDVGAESIDGP